jgi:uncharacterized membrane protein
MLKKMPNNSQLLVFRSFVFFLTPVLLLKFFFFFFFLVVEHVRFLELGQQILSYSTLKLYYTLIYIISARVKLLLIFFRILY